MADLRIVDAPLLSTVKGTEKIPTGGEGNFSVSVNQVADFAKLKWFLATEGYVDNAVGNVQADLNLHKNNVSNPHNVTKTQVGLDNVDNTADLDKPVSNATQAAIISANSGKADTTYVDNAVGAISTDASKQYATLALANDDIANIALNQNVFVSEAENGGYWYKVTVGATSLTKSAYDPLTQAKTYTDTEIDAIGIEQGLDVEISVAIIDENDNRTWLEADSAGKPTDYSKSIILEKIDQDVSTKVQTEVIGAGIEHIASPDMAVAIVDTNDNRTWLEADIAGKPTQYAADCIIEVINFNDVAIPSKFKSAYQLTENRIVSGPDIVCWGDSMTAGSGGNGTTYPIVLKNLLQNEGILANTYNMGVGGETSVTICARQGGNPFIISVTGGVIPATATPVTVTLDQIDGQVVRPLLQGAGTFTGYLGDISGTLNLVEPSGNSATWQTDNYYTFTRTIVGSEITLNRPTPFYLDVATPTLGDISIIWIGQNGPSTARSISDAKAMINKMQALEKRYLVISKPTSTDADDSLFFAEFGRRFIAARKYLVQYGLQDAGITPTTQDNTDITSGVVPTSLRSDAVHWNAQGYTILANLLFNRIKELGWI